MLSMNATAILTIKGTMKEAVELRAMSRDGRAPGVLHIGADPEVIEVAYHHKRVWLELLGFKFRTRVVGRIEQFSVLLVASEPFFQTMAKHLKEIRYQHPIAP
jgi:hypothetical protein